MDFKLIWTETASEDLKEIVRYISHDDAEAAAMLADRIFEALEQALLFPMATRMVPERNDPAIRETILNPYRIIFLIDERLAVIHILRIWHSSRGEPWV